MQNDFVANLRLLCDFYPSIAEVCRRLDINRSQFNRYLNGKFRPRHSVLRKMCVLFGVEEHEFFLPHKEFCQLVQVGRDSSGHHNLTPSIPEELMAKGQEGMEKYIGNYYEYYYSMSSPGKLIRTLVTLEKRSYGTVYQRTERMRLRTGTSVFHNRYHGIALKLSDRIFLVDYETVNGNEITQTVLFPSFKSKISILTGVKIGVADSSTRMPCCVRVLYEKIKETVSVREALQNCGLVSTKDDNLDPSIEEIVTNTILNNEHHFNARHHPT